MQRSCVRLSVCPIDQQRPAGLLLSARRIGDICRLLQQRRANAGSAALLAYVVAEHRHVTA